VDYDQKCAQRLTDLLVKNPRSPDAGVWMNDLLSEFQRGYPLLNLRPLLLHEDPDVAAGGAWIASELGAQGRPLLDIVSRLLQHSDRRVRFNALDCVLLWTDTARGPELCEAVRLLDDSDPAVRWKAMDFLSRASEDQLQAALADLRRERPQSGHNPALAWLLTAGKDPQQVITSLSSPDPLLRKYGAVAAARLPGDRRKPLSLAAASQDPDVKRFAESSMRLG